jgi:hypothetical protein
VNAFGNACIIVDPKSAPITEIGEVQRRMGNKVQMANTFKNKIKLPSIPVLWIRIQIRIRKDPKLFAGS